MITVFNRAGVIKKKNYKHNVLQNHIWTEYKNDLPASMTETQTYVDIYTSLVHECHR